MFLVKYFYFNKSLKILVEKALSYGASEQSDFITKKCASNLVVTLRQVVKPLSLFPRQ